VKEKRFLFFLFVISFLIRAVFSIVFFCEDKKYIHADTACYNEVGTQIVQGKGISLKDGSSFFNRVPGYSLFIALVYKIFGINISYVEWAQIFIASLIPILIFFLSLTFFPQNMLLAKVVSVYSAFHVGFIIFSCYLMSESLFIVFFLLFLLFFFSRTSSFTHIFLSGLFLGIASLVRPVGHYMLLILVFLLFLQKICFLEKLKRITLFLVAWIIPIGWLLLRNYLLTGFMFFHTLPGKHFLSYVAVPIYMNVSYGSQDSVLNRFGTQSDFYRSCKKIYHEWEQLMDQERRKKGRALHEIEESIVAERLTLDYIKKYPFLAFKNGLFNMFKTCCSLYSADILNLNSSFSKDRELSKKRAKLGRFARYLYFSGGSYVLFFTIYYEIISLLFILLGFIGCFFVVFKNKKFLFQFFPIVLFVGFFIFISFADGIARLRFPIEPFLIIFACYFWLCVVRNKCFSKKRMIKNV